MGETNRANSKKFFLFSIYQKELIENKTTTKRVGKK